MQPMPANLPSGADLERLLRQRIVERTGGRIERLQVKVSAERILIAGRAANYHLKQLVIQAAFDIIRSVGKSIDIDVRIVVSPPVVDSPRSIEEGGS